MSKPYRPSNGSEGECFQLAFCNQCTKDTEDVMCDILNRSFWYPIGDPEYPTEWIVDDDGLNNPRCTAFQRKG
jgi:hypothetical protein